MAQLITPRNRALSQDVNRFLLKIELSSFETDRVVGCILSDGFTTFRVQYQAMIDLEASDLGGIPPKRQACT
jgi:hypothetical protein